MACSERVRDVQVWVDKIVANMLDNTTTDQANKKILGTESQQRSAMEQRTLAIQRLTFDSISPDDHKQTVSDYISAENTLAQLNNEHEMCVLLTLFSLVHLIYDCLVLHSVVLRSRSHIFPVSQNALWTYKLIKSEFCFSQICCQQLSLYHAQV